MAAGQRLRQQDHVWFDVPVLDREKLARTSHAGLNLVRDQQRAVLAT
jgi:hypothetical protein